MYFCEANDLFLPVRHAGRELLRCRRNALPLFRNLRLCRFDGQSDGITLLPLKFHIRDLYAMTTAGAGQGLLMPGQNWE